MILILFVLVVVPTCGLGMFLLTRRGEALNERFMLWQGWVPERKMHELDALMATERYRRYVRGDVFMPPKEPLPRGGNFGTCKRCLRRWQLLDDGACPTCSIKEAERTEDSGQ